MTILSIAEYSDNNSKRPQALRACGRFSWRILLLDLLLLSTQQEDIPSPSADMLMLRIVNLCAITEFVTVLVRLFRLFVID